MISRHTDRDTGGSSVVLDLDFQGDEIPETTTRIRRRVWADDPDDLSSPMHYEVTRVDFPAPARDPALDGSSPPARRVLAVLDADANGETVRTIGDALARRTGWHRSRRARSRLPRRSSWRPDLAEPTAILGSSGGQWRSTPCAFDRIGGRRCLLTRAHIAHAHSVRIVR